jgi:hypothetical protein
MTENLLVASTTLMRASGFTALGIFGLGHYYAPNGRQEGAPLARANRPPLRADDPAGDLYMAQLRLRSRCAAIRCCCASTGIAGLNPPKARAQ